MYHELRAEGLSDAQIGRILGGAARPKRGKYLPFDPRTPGMTPGLEPFEPPPGWGGEGLAAPTAEGGVCGTDIRGAGEPWSIVTQITLAAGALSGTADLGQVFDASESFMIDDDNKVPDDFSAEGIQVYLGVASVDDGGAEHLGELLGFYLRELDGAGDGQEKAIWPLAQLGTTLGYFGGFGTSTGAVGEFYKLNATPIPWLRNYSTQGTYSLALRHTNGFTSINVIIVTVVLSGRRFTSKSFGG